MENKTNLVALFNDLNSTNVSLSNDTLSGKGPSTLKVVFDVVITTGLVSVMFSMGCSIEFWKLIQHLRRPIGAAIGMLAQFIVLPLATFGLAHALQLEPIAAIGMLVMGCCPGGSMSNLFSYWADGDVALSLTMTTLATLLAFVMMPFNLWIYSRSWTSESLLIPYTNIVISLVTTLGPAAVGIFVRWKWEKIALVITKIGSVIGVLAVILPATLLSVLYPFIYKSSWKLYVGAYVLPFAGFALGYTVAKIFRMSPTHARTVALETGIQNFPLCLTLITLSFPKHMIPKLVIFPFLYGVLSQINSCTFVLCYHIGKKIRKYRKGKRTGGGEFTSVPTKDSPGDVEMDIVVAERTKVNQ